MLAPQASVAPEWCTVTPKRFLILAAVPLVLALTACGASTPEEVIAAVEQRVDDSQQAGTASSAEMLSYDELPDCAEVASSAGDLIGDFVPSPDGHEGVNEQPLAIDLSCVWLTPQTVDQDLSGLAKFGGISIGVTIEKNPSSRADNEAAGLVHEYAPADDIGAYVLSLNPEFDPADELSAIGVIVNKGNVSIVVSAVGLYIDAGNIVESRTNALGIETALRIHEAMRR